MAVVHTSDLRSLPITKVRTIPLVPGEVVLFLADGKPVTAFQVSERGSLRLIDTESPVSYLRYQLALESEE